MKNGAKTVATPKMIAGIRVGCCSQLLPTNATKATANVMPNMSSGDCISWIKRDLIAERSRKGTSDPTPGLSANLRNNLFLAFPLRCILDFIARVSLLSAHVRRMLLLALLLLGNNFLVS
jgi:hypothetical protein